MKKIDNREEIVGKGSEKRVVRVQDLQVWHKAHHPRLSTKRIKCKM